MNQGPWLWSFIIFLVNESSHWARILLISGKHLFKEFGPIKLSLLVVKPLDTEHCLRSDRTGQLDVIWVTLFIFMCIRVLIELH